ncbi:MAG: hypothetical protein C4287_21850 [Leptolyngbya sp. ERB_1_2]
MLLHCNFDDYFNFSSAWWVRSLLPLSKGKAAVLSIQLFRSMKLDRALFIVVLNTVRLKDERKMKSFDFRWYC